MKEPWLSETEIRRIVSDCSFCALLGKFNARLTVSFEPGVAKLGIELQNIPDRDNAKAAGPLGMSEKIIIQAWQNEKIALMHIRRLLLNFIKHEAEESFLFRGQRILDPHAEEERLTDPSSRA